MKKIKKPFNKKEFQELCEHVCRQLTPSHSRELDRETLYFAIYWKICDVTGQKLFMPSGAGSKISDYRRKIQNSLEEIGGEIFDASSVADNVIRFYVDSGIQDEHYSIVNPELSPPLFLSFSDQLARSNN